MSGRFEMRGLSCWLLPAIVVLVPFDIALPPDGFTRLFLRPLMIGVAVLAVAGLVLGPRHNVRRLVYPVALAIGGLAFAVLIADDQWLAGSVAVRLLVVLLCFSWASTVACDLDSELFSRAVAVMVLLSVVVGLAVFVLGSDVALSEVFLGRVSTTNGVTRLTRPFSQANLAAFVWASASTYLLVGWAARSHSQNDSALLGAAGLLGLAATVLTQSRGGTVAIVAGLIAAAIVLRHHKRARHLVASAGVATAGLFVVGGWVRAPRIEAAGERSASRFEIWNQAVNAFRSEPFTGVGPGHFGKYWVANPIEGVQAAAHGHNVLLEVLATMGIVGLFSVLPILVLVVRGMFSGVTASSAPVQAALIVMFVHSGVDYPLIFTSSGVWFAIFAGLSGNQE